MRRGLFSRVRFCATRKGPSVKEENEARPEKQIEERDGIPVKSACMDPGGREAGTIQNSHLCESANSCVLLWLWWLLLSAR